jgi:cyclin B
MNNPTAPKSSLPGKLERAKQYTQLPQPQPVTPGASALVTKEAAAPIVKSAADDKSNVQNAAEYASGIFGKCLCDEAVFLPKADYMDLQSDLTSKMRTILIDWLIEVHMKYKLRMETLHLTVNLVDRYLSHKREVRKRLQLVGVVALMIASKFEEIHPPELRDWVYICDNAYTQQDVLALECTMLSTLSFEIMVPTAALFFEFLQRTNECDEVHHEVAQYLLELGLLDIRMLNHTPSQVACAALLLSNEMLSRTPAWPATMVQHSRHSEHALRSCVQKLRELFDADRAGEGGQLQAVHKKFSAAQRHAVAKMTFPGLQ